MPLENYNWWEHNPRFAGSLENTNVRTGRSQLPNPSFPITCTHTENNGHCSWKPKTVDCLLCIFSSIGISVVLHATTLGSSDIYPEFQANRPSPFQLTITDRLPYLQKAVFFTKCWSMLYFNNIVIRLLHLKISKEIMISWIVCSISKPWRMFLITVQALLLKADRLQTRQLWISTYRMGQLNTVFILVLLSINYGINFHMNDCKPNFLYPVHT